LSDNGNGTWVLAIKLGNTLQLKLHATQHVHVVKAQKLHAKMKTTAVLGLRNGWVFFSPLNAILPLKKKKRNRVGKNDC